MLIPAGLRRTADGWGDAGRAWIDGLPALIDELSRRWDVRLEDPFVDAAGSSAWVAPGLTAGGEPVVMKIALPHDEARTEAAGLRFFGDQSAVRLVAADEPRFALLLERCLPGHNLHALPVPEADAVAADVLSCLWRSADRDAGIGTLADTVAQWHATYATARLQYPPALVAAAVERGHELVETQADEVVVHGDFNPGNVLAAQRQPWLVIDPKPLIGDRAYDLAQWLANFTSWAFDTGHADQVMQTRVIFFADTLGLDPGRITGWAFVKSLGWDWGAEVAQLFFQLMKSNT